jgi:hypothetical protein
MIYISFRSEFDVSPQVFLTREQVPDHEISLRSAARKAAIGTGQGFCPLCVHEELYFKEMLLEGKKGNLYNSKCHGSLPCSNK